MHKKAALSLIIQCCQNRFNHGDIANWKHGDFLELSNEIYSETEVNISVNTLKRIFGKITVEDDYLPQQATIDALKKYGRYDPSVVIDQTLDVAPQTPVLPSAPQSPIKQNKRRFLWLSVLSIIAIGIIAFYFSKNGNRKTVGQITLSEMEGVLPATAYFNVKCSKGNDSLFLDFGDKSTQVVIDKSSVRAAHVYLFPGVFNVSLQTRTKVIARTKVVVRSQGWIAFSYHRQRELPNHYYAFPAIATGPDSLFHISNLRLAQMGLDTFSSLYTRIANFSPLSQKVADDFIFEATFRNSLPEKGIYCSSTQFQIVGLRNFIRFRFSSVGCSYRAAITLSEQTYNGTTLRLSSFAIHLEKWNTIRIVNKNKNVTLFLNNKPLYKGVYKNSLGSLQGMFIEFEGNGYAKQIRLKTSGNDMLYSF